MTQLNILLMMSLRFPTCYCHIMKVRCVDKHTHTNTQYINAQTCLVTKIFRDNLFLKLFIKKLFIYSFQFIHLQFINLDRSINKKQKFDIHEFTMYEHIKLLYLSLEMSTKIFTQIIY